MKYHLTNEQSSGQQTMCHVKFIVSHNNYTADLIPENGNRVTLQ